MFVRLYKIIKTAINFIYAVIVTFPRDINGLFYKVTVEAKLKKFDKTQTTVFQIFYQLVKKFPNKPCIVSENLTLTFKEVEDYSNRIAHVFSKNFQLKKGDAVALFMENRAEFPCIWLGLSKLGVITALINTNLRSKALVHSITVAEAKVVIYSAELTQPLDEIRKELNPQLKYVVLEAKSKTDFIKLENLLQEAPAETFQSTERVLSSDVLMYIYTSGTTGLPKPAVIKHSRYIAGGYTFFKVSKLTPKDIVYVTLPIYHGHGGIIGIGAAFISGGTVVLKKKFSATNFWKDCIEYRCTATVYVGELMRYLVNQPPSHLDKKHSVRIAIGNGLRANVWPQVVERFGVQPVEFYAASEGNCTLVNLAGKVGACGFVPVINRLIKSFKIFTIKIDDNMNPIRDDRGFCIKCEPNEKGLLIGIIGDTSSTAYSGYANNKQASEKKIINDLFSKGQKAFNTGDLMMFDNLGYVYFCDRLGETYRWRGENVSTVEVENIISEKLNSTEVIVYGVEIPGQEGRAGMATITNENIDMTKFYDDIKNELTSYARPLFVRLVKEAEHTGTFKAKKNTLVDEGFNINIVKDKVYYFDQKQQAYLPLTKNVYDDIMSSKMKI